MFLNGKIRIEINVNFLWIYLLSKEEIIFRGQFKVLIFKKTTLCNWVN